MAVRKAIDPTLPVNVQTEAVWRPGDAIRVEWTADAEDDGRTIDWLFWTVAACDGAWLRLVARSVTGAEHTHASTYTILVPLAWVACAEIGADDVDFNDDSDEGSAGGGAIFDGGT